MSTKAARYLQALDAARCNGNWKDVPELVRKIRKHAPERSCLALTADAECASNRISAETTQNRTLSSQHVSTLSSLLPSLLQAAEKETKHLEDSFQAKASLSWMYMVLGDHMAATAVLPDNVERTFSQLGSSPGGSSAWTRICAIKAYYVKGSTLAKGGRTGEALEALASAMPILKSTQANAKNDAELQTWAELLLTQYCVLSSHTIKAQPTARLEADMLSAFREWSAFWTRSGNTASVGGFSPQADVSRRYVWKLYYLVLSTILCESLPYPTTSLATTYSDASTRRMQWVELQRVESIYEQLILKEVSFPRAEQASEEIEEWAALVVRNWSFVCVGSWDDADLGQGGREALSRKVLDILYRAATKTFHSTAILRHLFTVHLAVADFDLAFKAFDTYSEIVLKGKARLDKTGEVDEGLDDDETVLRTVSLCIKALCRYGALREAEKARSIAHTFKDWVLQRFPEKPAKAIARDINATESQQSAKTYGVASSVRAEIWGAIGTAEAQWSRMTFDAAARSDLQLEAIKCLGKSLSKEYDRSKDINSLFALAMVFAERREIGSAIEVVKSALMPASSFSFGADVESSPFARERALIPLWHLLALLLSARQEFVKAARACEGAFEQFGDAQNLFGESGDTSAYRSEHLNENHEEHKAQTGIIDTMDDHEKEAILEIKMTQLALVEIIDGPEEAVNACDQLLSLYARLFGAGKHVASTTNTSRNLPPQSSSGTLRSLKGSIFGRKSVRTSSGPPVSGQMAKLADRPGTAQTSTTMTSIAPAIQVINEHGNAPAKQREKLRKRSGSLTKQRSLSRSSRSASIEPRTSSIVGSNSVVEPARSFEGIRMSQVGLAVSPDNALDFSATSLDSTSQTLPPPAQNLPQKETSLKPLDGPSQQDTRLPRAANKTVGRTPITRLPKIQQQRRRNAMLIRVWLFVAGLYRRAELFDDGKGAIEEAQKLVQALEIQLTSDPLTNVVADAQCGAGKDVEELWADVLSERGNLSVARKDLYTAISDYETSLIHFADHPTAIVGLSELLLDIYTEKLPPLPTIPALSPPTTSPLPSTATLSNGSNISQPSNGITSSLSDPIPERAPGPLGLPRTTPPSTTNPTSSARQPPSSSTTLEPPHMATSTSLLDRLAARDRAYALLNNLTKLGTGWNNSEAWSVLARAYELGGQVNKARDALWWCVELEEGRGIRDWFVVGSGGYVL